LGEKQKEGALPGSQEARDRAEKVNLPLEIEIRFFHQLLLANVRPICWI
jgi:hypothetical protein